MIIQVQLLILIKNMLAELSVCIYWQFCLVNVFQCMKFISGQYIGSFLENFSFPGTSVMKVSLAFTPFYPLCLPSCLFFQRPEKMVLFRLFIFLRNPESFCYVWSWHVSAIASAAQTCYCNNFGLFLIKLLLYHAYLQLVESRSFWVHADLPA